MPDADISIDREDVVPARTPPAIRLGDVDVHHADEQDIPAIVTLNNLYAPDGLTLQRSEAFVTMHLQ